MTGLAVRTIQNIVSAVWIQNVKLK